MGLASWLLQLGSGGQDAVAVKPHGFFNDNADNGAARKPGDASAVKPCHLLWRELHC